MCEQPRSGAAELQSILRFSGRVPSGKALALHVIQSLGDLMKRVAGLVVVFAAVCAWAQQHSRVDGCLAVQGNQYILLQGQHTRYVLQGMQDELKRHVGQTVRIEGQVFRGNNGPGGLKVTGISTLQPNCAMTVPPGAVTDSITGKTGNEGVAVPDTTTGTAGETTPGYQTEAGIAQQPGKHTEPATKPNAVGDHPSPPPQGPGAPPDWEKAGENPASANTMAEAAARAEVQPGAPMGTKPSAPASAGEQPQSKVPRTEAGTQQDRTIEIRNGQCLPEKLTIRPGEAVQWVNNSIHRARVASTNMQTATGANGSGAFAGNVNPGGGKFTQVFTREGTYSYTCSEGNGPPKNAQIEVKEQ